MWQPDIPLLFPLNQNFIAGCQTLARHTACSQSFTSDSSVFYFRARFVGVNLYSHLLSSQLFFEISSFFEVFSGASNLKIDRYTNEGGLVCAIVSKRSYNTTQHSRPCMCVHVWSAVLSQVSELNLWVSMEHTASRESAERWKCFSLPLSSFNWEVRFSPAKERTPIRPAIIRMVMVHLVPHQQFQKNTKLLQEHGVRSLDIVAYNVRLLLLQYSVLLFDTGELWNSAITNWPLVHGRYPLTPGIAVVSPGEDPARVPCLVYSPTISSRSTYGRRCMYVCTYSQLNFLFLLVKWLFS